MAAGTWDRAGAVGKRECVEKKLQNLHRSLLSIWLNIKMHQRSGAPGSLVNTARGGGHEVRRVPAAAVAGGCPARRREGATQHQ